MDKIVVYAPINAFDNQRIYDKNYMGQFPGGIFISDLIDSFQQLGYQVILLSEYLRSYRHCKALLVSDLGIGQEYCGSNLVAHTCINLESPTVANRFAFFFGQRTSKYKHVYTYSGFKQRLSNSDTIFHSIVWPHEYTETIDAPDWRTRQFLVLVANNKSAFQLRSIPRSFDFSFLKALLQNMLTLCIKYLDPWMRHDLYPKRREIVDFFISNSDLSLFGRNWPHPVLAKSCGSTVESKIRTISHYKFVLVLQTTSFPGEICEKIFDALIAKSIPVYLGSNEIYDWVPSECFIDINGFSSLADLKQYLDSVSPDRAAEYLDAGSRYISSSQYRELTSSNLALKIAHTLDNDNSST